LIFCNAALFCIRFVYCALFLLHVPQRRLYSGDTCPLGDIFSLGGTFFLGDAFSLGDAFLLGDTFSLGDAFT